MSHHYSIDTSGPSQMSLITYVLFNVGDESTLWYLVEGQDIPNSQGSLLSTVDVLASVHSLHGQEVFLLMLVLVGIPKDNLGQGGRPSGVMHYLLHHSLDVALPL